MTASVVRARSGLRQLSIGGLGVCVSLLVILAWMSGLTYLVVRLGKPSPVSLTRMDGVHVYVGLVGGLILLFKAVSLGHSRDAGRRPPSLQRVIPRALLVLYGLICLTGILLLLPIHGLFYLDLVQAHLMVSVWAVPPTIWHIWVYRRRALLYLIPSLASSRPWRLAAAAVLVGGALVVLLANPRALSQLPQVTEGATWSPVGLGGHYLNREAVAFDGSLVVVGDAVYASSDGATWTHLDLPPVSAAGSTGGAAGGPGHAGMRVGNLALSLATSARGIYVGAKDGLYWTADASGPLLKLMTTTTAVRGIAVDPVRPDEIWISSRAGPWFSPDGGRTWSSRSGGLDHPDTVAAITYLGSEPVLGNGDGVFAWNPAANAWRRISDRSQVLSLTASGGDLYSTSPAGVALYRGGVWTSLSPLETGFDHPSSHRPGSSLVGLTSVDGRLYAVGTSSGVSASADGGQTWTQLAGGLAGSSPQQVMYRDGFLLAVSADGLYRLPIGSGEGAGPGWLWNLAFAVLLSGAAAIVLVTGLPAPGFLRRRVPPGAGGPSDE